MAIKQVLWSIDDNKQVQKDKLNNEMQLEVILEKNVELLNPDWMVIGRQVSVYGKFIDLLAIDRAGDLIVIELKKDRTPRDITAQVLEYGAIISEFESDDIARIFDDYKNRSIGQEYKEYFGVELDEDDINNNTQLVIVATSMDASTERIIKYLNTFSLNINVLLFDVFEIDGKKLLSRTWMVEYEETISEQKKEKKQWNGEFYVSFGIGDSRSWNDAVKYGFITASGGTWYTQTLKMLSLGDRVWVNVPNKGYVGVGIVESEAELAKDLILYDDKTIFEIDRNADYASEHLDDELSAYMVKVKWIKTFKIKDAVSEVGFFGNQNTVCKPKTQKWENTVEILKKRWEIRD